MEIEHPSPMGSRYRYLSKIKTEEKETLGCSLNTEEVLGRLGYIIFQEPPISN